MARPLTDALLRVCGLFVAAEHRRDWLDEWRAELWHEAQAHATSGLSLVRLALGAIPDALAMNAHVAPQSRGRRVTQLERCVMLFQELRYSLRGLLRSPAFTFVAVLTLALGIGANAALFTLVQSVLLDPLPYAESDRLVRVTHPVPGVGVATEWDVSPSGYFHFREHARALEELGAYALGEVNMTGSGGAIRATAATVTSSLFDVLGARAILGRVFTADEDVPNGPRVAVLSHGIWQRSFGSDPSVVGRIVVLDGEGFEIIGVLAQGFDLPEVATDFWLTSGLDPAARPVNSHYLNTIGRLAPGATIAGAESELRRLMGEFTQRFPTAYDDAFMRNTGFGLVVRDLRETVVGDISATLWILFGAVALVLAIALANVANLYLVRIESRGREVAVRTALGAGRVQLAGFFLTETFVLSAAASLVGLLLAYAAMQLLTALAPADLPRLAEVAMGWRSVAFTLGLTLLVGLVLGSFPMLRFRRMASSAPLAGSRSVTAGRRHHVTQGALVVAQVGLALMLIAAAALMLRSFERLRNVHPGFDPDNLLTLSVSLPFAAYPTHDAPAEFHAELLRRVRELPGVASAGGATSLPLTDLGFCTLLFTESGLGLPGGTVPAPCLPMHRVSADYFETMRIPVVAGREIELADEQARNGSVVIPQVLAERLWPGESAVGKRLRPYGWGEPWYTVVGVAGDVRHAGLDAPPGEVVYYPLARIPDQVWAPPYNLTLVVRPVGGSALSLAEPIRRIVADMDPNVAVADIRDMHTVVAASTARTTFAMMLLATAATVALLLGAIGLYGVVSYVVTQRRREMGIRMAVGARADQVARMVLGRSLRLAAIGTAIGVIGAIAVGRVLQALLFEISATDPLTLAAAAGLLLGVMLVASYLPARRAGRVDPVEALRVE